MSNDIIVRAENVSKKFCRSLKHVMLYGAKDIARNAVGLSSHSEELRDGEFWAVDDVSFDLRRGETLGLIGPNGSGKSTLLKMLNGIFMPDKGKIVLKGRVGALIEVGAGFHPMLTGRENIYINGVILGMSKKEIDKKFDEIVAFADIGDFIDSPVKHYSSGMYVRLGFAVAAHMKPDILLVDEVLAVGDAKFQRKCLDRLIKLKEDGMTFILVSHNMQAIEGSTNSAILLDKGKKVAYGFVGEVVSQYDLMMQTGVNRSGTNQLSDNSDPDALPLVHKYLDWGTDEILVKRIRLLNSYGVPKKTFETEERVTLAADLEINKNVDKGRLWISFINGEGVVCLGARQLISLKKNVHKLRVQFDPIQLTTGNYKISFHIFDDTFTNPYTQGQYGYFSVRKNSSVRVPGQNSPYCWAKLEVELL